MASVIGVRFRNAGKLYYFDPGQLWPTAGDAVIVETVRGMEYGEVVTGVKEVSDELITPPLKKVIRIATPEDAQHQMDNQSKEKDALAICQKKVDEHKLQMKLVGCEYTFDNSKLLFYFTSEKRVDFRVLVKDLASIFRTRIELRQIGVRDEAKMMGGLGICGRPVCCAAFLGDFQPVSIKMAKEQSLSLNPTKISGVCGRLMCCLKYEEDHYEATRKLMPKIGKEVSTPDGNGTVVDLNILKETVRVRIPKGDGTEQKDYPMEEVQRIAPIPRLNKEGKKPRPEKAEADEKKQQRDAEKPEAKEAPEKAVEPEQAEEKPAAEEVQAAAPVSEAEEAAEAPVQENAPEEAPAEAEEKEPEAADEAAEAVQEPAEDEAADALDNDQPDEESVVEYALDEGLTEDEALAEIEEIAEEAEEEAEEIREEEAIQAEEEAEEAENAENAETAKSAEKTPDAEAKPEA